MDKVSTRKVGTIQTDVSINFPDGGSSFCVTSSTAPSALSPCSSAVPLSFFTFGLNVNPTKRIREYTAAITRNVPRHPRRLSKLCKNGAIAIIPTPEPAATRPVASELLLRKYLGRMRKLDMRRQLAPKPKVTLYVKYMTYMLGAKDVSRKLTIQMTPPDKVTSRAPNRVMKPLVNALKKNVRAIAREPTHAVE